MPGTANTTNFTLVSEHGQLGIPCRCGELHIGAYAMDAYLQHQCLHQIDLLAIGYPGNVPTQVICPLCGMSWRVVESPQ